MPFGTISFPLPLTLYPILLWSLYLFDHIHSILYNWHIFFSLFVKYLCFRLTIILNNSLWSIFFSNTLDYAISWFLIALYPQKAHPFFFLSFHSLLFFIYFFYPPHSLLYPFPFLPLPLQLLPSSFHITIRKCHHFHKSSFITIHLHYSWLFLTFPTNSILPHENFLHRVFFSQRIYFIPYHCHFYISMSDTKKRRISQDEYAPPAFSSHSFSFLRSYPNNYESTLKTMLLPLEKEDLRDILIKMYSSTPPHSLPQLIISH